MQKEKGLPAWGALLNLKSLWVLVTQLTVVSEENQEISCTDNAVLVEVLRTSVLGACDGPRILSPIEAQDREKVIRSNCVVTVDITRAFAKCHLLKTLGQEDVSIPNGRGEHLADASIDFAKNVSNCVNFSRVVTRGDRLTVH